MSLSVVQQHLLDFIKTVRVSSIKTASEFYQKLVGEERTTDLLKQEISTINKFIKQFDIEITECTDEITSEKILVLINTISDDITQRAKFYDKSAVQFFSEIVKECIISKYGNITETNCLNLSCSAEITKTAAQNIIHEFVKEKWLASKDGTISLGMRAILELQQTLKQLYPNHITYCKLCKCITVQSATVNTETGEEDTNIESPMIKATSGFKRSKRK
ncbi:hypothetical protein RUM43_007550 [Polyplax serrata]|uniref:Non-structural maintenance of chromosomes element 1 homolog n=1 Tax=Polyplax serrata TaxID=468196 RepID=A0AAN8PMF3_POLSC